MILRFTLLFLLFLVSSCGSKKAIRNTSGEQRNPEVSQQVERERENARTDSDPQREVNQPITYKDKIAAYIATFAPIAQEEMRLYKIPASITLAQGILESGAGEGELTLKAMNHFGIKCHDWDGAKVYHDDDRDQECFRKYSDPKYSYRDHSLFLTGRKRYAGLFDLKIDDYRGWARGLREAGYATDRRYPEKLISLIERYQLYRFDSEVLGKTTGNYAVSQQEGERYVVQKGDTLYSIAKRYDLTVEQLKRYNNLRGTVIGIGQVLYITP